MTMSYAELEQRVVALMMGNMRKPKSQLQRQLCPECGHGFNAHHSRCLCKRGGKLTCKCRRTRNELVDAAREEHLADETERTLVAVSIDWFTWTAGSVINFTSKGTHTGRMHGSQPNYQNMPKRARR
jgi:hypothetical protein